MNAERSTKNLTPSICEEALENFSKSDDSLADLVAENHIEVRDFMILSFVCDQNEMAIDQLMSALGLTRATVTGCVERLQSAGLVYYSQAGETAEESNRVSPTPPGRSIVQRILDDD